MAEPHDFNDTVVAILDDRGDVQETANALRNAGYEVEVLTGDEGIDHLDPAGGESDTSVFRSMLEVFGDQRRIVDQLTEALASGKSVVSVESDPEEATEAVRILTDHGGHYVWKFGDWTYTRIATDETDEG